MSTYSMETHCRIYDDGDGVYISVGPDADALGQVEVKTEGGAAVIFGAARLVIPADMALLLAQAITRVANDIKAGEDV